MGRRCNGNAIEPVNRRIWYNGPRIPVIPEGTANMVFQEQLTLSTHRHGEMRDLTKQVADIVAPSKVRTGVAHVFAVGSTAAAATVVIRDRLPRRAAVVPEFRRCEDANAPMEVGDAWK